MSDEFLIKILSGVININDVVFWLQNKSPQNKELVAPCSRIDFVLYFLSFLRNQTSSILQNSPKNDATPSTPILVDPPDVGKCKPNEEINIIDKAMKNGRNDDQIITTSVSQNSFKVDNSLENANHTNISYITPNKNVSLESIISNVSPINQDSETNKSDVRFNTPNNKSINSHSTPLRILNSNSSKRNDSQSDLHYKKTFSTPNYKNQNHKMYKPNDFNNHSFNQSLESKSFPTDNNNAHHQSFERPTSQRTNICIGDFMVSKSNNVDKNGGRKKKQKFVNLSLDENNLNTSQYNKFNSEVLNIKDENSFPQIGTNQLSTRHQPRRRINPTRLNTSDQISTANTSMTNNEKFGMKCIKQEENEAFQNQSFHVNEQDTNFNVERNILKLEKEKLLQKFNTLGSSSSKSKSNPLKTVAVTGIVKNVVQIKSSPIITVTPKPECVTNSKALDILSILYSVILDMNLVVNFATEINFLISLLVSQGTVSNVENVKTILPDVNTKSDRGPVHSLEDEDSTSSCVMENLNELVTSKNVTHEYSVISSTTESALVNRPLKDENNLSNDLLVNIHNCVYFSLKTLNFQIITLDSILDNTTVRMLQQNLRVKTFSPDLSEHLKVVSILRQTVRESQQPQGIVTNKNVCFISETDSVENFQTQQGFFTFKKQRDLFYEILRCWESQHNTPNWNFNVKIGAMIRTLLNMSVSPSNLAHLARLFREQLIVNCTGRKTIDEDSLPEVAGVSADRLNKLAQRLVAAPTRNTSQKDSKPDFPEYQEFFKDFLIVADNTGFRQHVTDSLIEEIFRLNATQFSSVENENVVNEKIKMQYLNCVVNLQVLGKFLGLILSLPYRSPIAPSPTSSGQHLAAKDVTSLSQQSVPKEKVLQSDIQVRCQTQPPFNLLNVLKCSRKNHRLILTVPWIIQLLAMLDYSTLRLPYYNNVIYILLKLYQKCVTLSDKQYTILQIVQSKETLKINNINSMQMTQTSQILLKTCLGWFFDMVHFPQNTFYNFLRNSESDFTSRHIANSRRLSENLENENGNSIVNILTNINLKDNNPLDEETDKEIKFVNGDINLTIEQHSFDENYDENDVLDFLNLIDCNITLNVCPHLKELKCLLISNKELTSGSDNRTFRHITPVTSSLTEDIIKKNRGKQIQIQLEEWFLRSQSQSTSRVLKSVGERVASALLRLVRSQISYLKNMAHCGVQHFLLNDSETNIESETEKLNVQLLKAFRVNCIYAARQCGKERTISALQGMLPPATAKPVFNLLVDLSLRRAIDTVTEWLNNNTNTEMLMTELSLDKLKIEKNISYEEIQRYINVQNITSKQNESVKEFSKENNITTIGDIETSFHSGADCIVNIKELCVQLISGVAFQSGIQYVQTSFEKCVNAADLCSKCTYINLLTKKTIGQLCLDLIILIISLFPSLLTSEVFMKFKTIWDSCLKNKISPDSKIDIPLNGYDAKKDITNDELALFHKHIFNNEQIYNTNTDIDSVNESLALLEVENLCAINNKSLNNAQDSIVNNDSKIDESIKVLNNGSENEVVFKCNEFFNTVLCSRNIMYFGQIGGGSIEVWKKLSLFLAFLLKNEYITEESLTEQCLAVYRKEWPQTTLENLATCIKDLSEIHKMSSEKLRLFLDFVVEFCHNVSGDYID